VEVPALSNLVTENGLTVAVGYQLRFHPALRAIREELAKHTIGKIISAQFYFAEWLPGMHAYEDYRESHAARADQGGGVIFCLSHEIDSACWLFGQPRRVFCQGGHFSSLELSDVEDTAHMMMDCDLDGRSVPISVYLDFVQNPPQRWCQIVGDFGKIHWDYYENIVRITTEAGTREISFEGFKRDSMFLDQCRNFVDAIGGKAEIVCSLGDGAATLDVCLAARESLASGLPVDLGA
jgi:predicted dehydrogenase